MGQAKEFRNVRKYEELKDSLNKSEEPLILWNVDKKAPIQNNVKSLLSYEGMEDLKIPGSFLSVVMEITSLPVAILIDILDFSKSTFYRIKDESFLEHSTIDKLARILKIYNRGLKAFDSKNDFNEWLKTKIISLGGRRPIDLLKTENGRSAVLNALDRIEFGTYG